MYKIKKGLVPNILSKYGLNLMCMLEMVANVAYLIFPLEERREKLETAVPHGSHVIYGSRFLSMSGILPKKYKVF